MKLSGIHFLLTYKCIFECDHCFLYSSPGSKGTFTVQQLKDVLDEAKKIDTVRWVYFEGGEPFLYYPIMLEGVKLARDRGFSVGIVTNSYWATSIKDAMVWLKPLADMEISDFSVSDDSYHFEDDKDNPSRVARLAAKNLEIPITTLTCADDFGEELYCRGRAAEKLIAGREMMHWEQFDKCPAEDFVNIGRIHLDPFGNMFICQGISIGNFIETPFSKLVQNYDPTSHPIGKILLDQGPAGLVRAYSLAVGEYFVDACHLCYKARIELLEKYPQYLCPKQVYGIQE